MTSYYYLFVTDTDLPVNINCIKYITKIVADSAQSVIDLIESDYRFYKWFIRSNWGRYHYQYELGITEDHNHIITNNDPILGTCIMTIDTGWFKPEKMANYVKSKINVNDIKEIIRKELSTEGNIILFNEKFERMVIESIDNSESPKSEKQTLEYQIFESLDNEPKLYCYQTSGHYPKFKNFAD